MSVLIRSFGDIDLAEDAVQEAFLRAVRRWPDDGVPPSPAGWIITTARNAAVDRLRREATRDARQAEAMQHLAAGAVGPAREDGPVPDDRLRLVFTCCHPALAPEAQIALTLRLVGGLTTAEIARSFMVPEPTVAQRISRAKAKIRAAAIPYRIPAEADLPERLGAVLAVLYLAYTEGHTATAGPDLGRPDLAAEAIRLGRVLRALMPDEPEVAGLLALMLLSEARRQARVGDDGNVVRLADQDRRLWDRVLIAEGQALVRECLRRGRPGSYQIQAAINAVHSDAATAEETDWSQILTLYDQWLAIAPTSVVLLNRAVALAEVDGPAAALDSVDELELDRYYLFHAVRADLLGRLGRRSEAIAALDAALVRTSNDAERGFLAQRRATLLSSG